MLNPNSRANTMISQSFIASEFQGYNDPFVKSEPTSALNQFVRSKQTSDSGFIQDGQNQAFGFNNITSNHEPKKLEAFSRKANEAVVTNVSETETRAQSSNSNQVKVQNNNFGDKPSNNLLPPQVSMNERYISPGIIKTDSPTKLNQFVSSQQRPPVQQQPVMNVQPAFNQQQQNSEGFYKINQNQQSQQQTFKTQQQSFGSQQSFTNQQSRAESAYSQNYQQQNEGSRVSNPVQSSGLEGSSVGKRLKLNVSQQFSNSFVLKCVNEPQKSSILQMKKRQRQYRKSIQNFFM